MIRRLLFVALLAVMVLAVAAPALANGRDNSGKDFGTIEVRHDDGTSTYWDTFVPVEVLPFEGKFQPLYPGDEMGDPSWTPYGPGDPGYVGGRWWVDNQEAGVVGEMDEADTFLLCPLLGPGRDAP